MNNQLLDNLLDSNEFPADIDIDINIVSLRDDYVHGDGIGGWTDGPDEGL